MLAETCWYGDPPGDSPDTQGSRATYVTAFNCSATLLNARDVRVPSV